MRYKQVKNLDSSIYSETILRIDENDVHSWIPNSLDNRDWQAYQTWLDEGNSPEAAD